MSYYYCSQCGKDKQIPKKVYAYSIEHFKRALCRECQEKIRNGGTTALEDIGKFTEQFGKVTSNIHKQGGLPLTLIFFGGLILILAIVLPIIFNQTPTNYFLIYALSFCLIIIGAYLHNKKNHK